MARYFIEVAYDGTAYSGFQIQENANTIQAEVTYALETFYKRKFELTGSSRTDAGVHARQNFFHFDTDEEIKNPDWNVYNLNAILPANIVVKSLNKVADDAHCRFDALSREYQYFIYGRKNPFIRNYAFFFPYKPGIEKLNEVAAMLFDYTDFTSFSKRKTQVKDFHCHILQSKWRQEDDQIIYTVESNRFLRGMVKALVGTMLRVGRGKLTTAEFRKIIEAKDCRRADFSVASRGLFLMQVKYK